MESCFKYSILKKENSLSAHPCFSIHGYPKELLHNEIAGRGYGCFEFDGNEFFPITTSESKSALIVEPALTSVAQPLSQMGEVAAKCILDKINGRAETYPATVVLEAALNVRESSVRIR